MVTREDLESFLIRMDLEYQEIEQLQKVSDG